MRILFSLLAICLASLTAMAWGPSAVTNPQGALWHLLETGRLDEAREYEKKLTDILQNSRPKTVYEISSGVSQSFLVEFENNIFAVVKTTDPKYPNSLNNEVAAYRVDRAIGLNMVPVTVVRKMNGLNVSAQIYYPQLPPGEYGRYVDFATDMIDIEVFDRLVGNGDRTLMNGHNIVRGDDDRMIAIDHARAFIDNTGTESYNTMSQPLADEISPKMKKKIADMNVPGFVEGLSDLLPENQKAMIRKKLEALKEAFSKERIEVPPTNIEPKEVSMSFPRPKSFIHLKIAARFDNRKREGAILPKDLLKAMTGSVKLRCEKAQR